ncbi:MAG TPA: tripartite tricarboxylate transporter substrate binding protein [Burkholderiales bacterium]|nr:tripartite tricarboxylate transporter substrate binding protein [Burkholderiales bacterium]
MKKFSAVIATSMVAALLLSFAGSALAQQEYPSRPVRFISPFAPGGGTDTVGRVLAPPLSRALGQNVIVENRAGGSTVIGTEVIARAPADGYTILIMSPSYTVNPFVRKLPYDTLRDFTGVTCLVSTAMVIAAHPSVPARNLKQLVALARSNPGALTYGTASTLGSQRIAGELFKSAAGVDIRHVPFNGGAQATLSTIGGHTTLLVTNIIEVAANARAGKLRVLGVTTIERSQVMPEVPTIAESGYPGFDAGNWFGAAVRSGTPKAIVDRLHTEITRALRLPEVRDLLLKVGLTPAPTTPDQFNAFIRNEMERNLKIIKALDIRVE